MTATWTEQFPVDAPDPREGQAMAYYEGQDSILLFGGIGASGEFSDTWVYDGTNWTLQTPSTTPPSRRFAAMCYDPGTGKILMFGGVTGASTNLTDTWVWDGADWTELFPVDNPGFQSVMCHDATNNNVVLWKQCGVASPTAETWLWDGSNWNLQTPANSPARRLTQINYDASLGLVVLWGGTFGGISFLYTDTWTWNGSDWTEVITADAPSVRNSYTMAYSDMCEGTILFGGLRATANVFENDTWSFDGINWTQLAPPISPDGRVLASCVVFIDPQSIVLFGGFTQGPTGATEYFGDTWSLSCGSIPPVAPSPPYLYAQFATV